MIDKFKSRKCRMVVAMLFVLIGIGGFLMLANLVAQGSVQGFDDSGIRGLRHSDDPAVPIGPHWLNVAAQDITAMGGAPVLVFVTAAVVGFFAFNRQFVSSGFVLAAVLSGLMLNLCLKAYFERPRPHLVPPLCSVDSYSFPSGHAMMSLIVYFSVCILLAKVIRRGRVQLYLFAVAILLTGLIGMSRIYLGVHYPTDVLAGWTAGMVWVTFCWLPVRKFYADDATGE